MYVKCQCATVVEVRTWYSTNMCGKKLLGVASELATWEASGGCGLRAGRFAAW